MMNVIVPTSSKCSSSSGCESGWTLYLQHSTSTTSSSFASFSENQHQKLQKIMSNKFEVDQNVISDNYEEDLSMVSDASSGPPHFDHNGDDDDEDDSGVRRFIRKQCMKSYAHEITHQCCSDNNDDNVDDDDFALDDTASSHVFTSKKIGGIHNVQNSEGVSFEKFIDYSSQGYSTTHFKVNLDRRN